LEQLRMQDPQAFEQLMYMMSQGMHQRWSFQEKREFLSDKFDLICLWFIQLNSDKVLKGAHEF
jgi:hypothetical protein